jgi:hypothetical protein
MVEFLELPVLERVLLKIAAKYGWDKVQAVPEPGPPLPGEIADDFEDFAGVGDVPLADKLPPLPEAPEAGAEDGGVIEIEADESSAAVRTESYGTRPAAPPPSEPPQPFGHSQPATEEDHGHAPMFPPAGNPGSLAVPDRDHGFGSVFAGLEQGPIPVAAPKTTSTGRPLPPPPPPKGSHGRSK